MSERNRDRTTTSPVEAERSERIYGATSKGAKLSGGSHARGCLPKGIFLVRVLTRLRESKRKANDVESKTSRGRAGVAELRSQKTGANHMRYHRQRIFGGFRESKCIAAHDRVMR